jgi:hypothetical protein
MIDNLAQSVPSFKAPKPAMRKLEYLLVGYSEELAEVPGFLTDYIARKSNMVTQLLIDPLNQGIPDLGETN